MVEGEDGTESQEWEKELEDMLGEEVPSQKEIIDKKDWLKYYRIYYPKLEGKFTQSDS